MACETTVTQLNEINQVYVDKGSGGLDRNISGWPTGFNLDVESQGVAGAAETPFFYSQIFWNEKAGDTSKTAKIDAGAFNLYLERWPRLSYYYGNPSGVFNASMRWRGWMYTIDEEIEPGIQTLATPGIVTGKH